MAWESQRLREIPRQKTGKMIIVSRVIALLYGMKTQTEHTGSRGPPLPEVNRVGIGLTTLSIKTACYRSIYDIPK